MVLSTPERLNKDNNCYYSSNCSRFYICQAELAFHPFGKCRQDWPPALQHFPVQVPKFCNLICSETAVKDVAGIALPVDLNPCFNPETTSHLTLLCLFQSLRIWNDCSGIVADSSPWNSPKDNDLWNLGTPE